MESSELCPRPLTRADAAALIGVLAVLEGQIMSGNVVPEAVERFRGRLADDGVLTGERENQDVPAALEALNQRVRFALGEYS
jgi:hypothetical protein